MGIGVWRSYFQAHLVGIGQEFLMIDYLMAALNIACENIRFSSIFAAGDVSRGGTSATQRQKFHSDDANQCLHHKFGSHINFKYKFLQFYVSCGRFW